MKINNDGSVEGQTFSGEKYTYGYPHPKSDESPEEYQERVDTEYRPKGFSLGDLSWPYWHYYCGNHPIEEESTDDEW